MQKRMEQAELARLVGSSQQTISRWENGKTRPQYDQVGAIAAALKEDVNELLAAAGYEPKQTVATFEQPLPLYALTSEAFERFTQHIVSELFADADVHRLGGQGHAQGGADIEAIFSDGKVFSFQCKRMEAFGPQKVHTAVAEHTRKAARKFIMLSGIASPEARDAIRTHKGWVLWDRESISSQFRSLPKEAQRKLVDVFFKGQRMALLGESEPGPWLSAEQYFAPFSDKTGAFHHSWGLVGRKEQLEDLVRAVGGKAEIVLLVAPAGVGKTRLLRALIQDTAAIKRGMIVRFLSQTEEITAKSLEDLGSGFKVLFVDDAHERTDLAALFSYAADPANRAKLVIALRPYGLNLLKAQAGRFALLGEKVTEIALERLSDVDARSLARQVLSEYAGPESAAADIARLTRDCPLATVVGARIVSKERRHLELVTNEAEFRHALMSAFEKIIAGEIGGRSEEKSISKLLRFIAVLQPIEPDDSVFLTGLEKVEGIPGTDAAGLIKLLVEGGVLFKRGGKYRLAPDLLADFIAERHCIGTEGRSTGYAEQVCDVVSGPLFEHIVVNLGRLDWRLSVGNTRRSRLLDGIWRKIDPQNDYEDDHVRAVKSVAFYQPERALRFVRDQMGKGKRLEYLPPILRYVAYTQEHLRDACEGLWELGKNDARELNPNSDHAIRILRSFCEVTDEKPREFIEDVVDFGVALALRPSSWGDRHTPLDFLREALTPDFQYVSASTARTMTWTTGSVSHAFAEPYRRKVIDLILKLLSSADRHTATAAAQTLGEAVRYPMRDSRDDWVEEITTTLKSVLEIVRTRPLRPCVLLAIVRSINWHAQYGDGPPAQAAQEIIDALPTDLGFRTVLGLSDSHGMLLEREPNFEISRARHAETQAKLAQEIISAFPDTDCLFDHLEAAFEDSGPEEGHGLMQVLLQESPALRDAVATRALAGSKSQTARYASTALSLMLAQDKSRAIEVLGTFLETGDPARLQDVGYAMSHVSYAAIGEEDIRILEALLANDDAKVVYSGLAPLRWLGAERPKLIGELVCKTNFCISPGVADRALALFQDNRGSARNLLDREQVTVILGKLIELPELRGHWIEEFLAFASKNFTDETARALMARVERSLAHSAIEYRAGNHGPYGHVPLRFIEAPEYTSVLRFIIDWMLAKRDQVYPFTYRAAEVFGWMFPFNETLLETLSDVIEKADDTGLGLVGRILEEAPNDFVFKHTAFAQRYLERCRQYGAECYQRASSHFFSSAISGMRHGTPGEPFPEDVLMRDRAEKVLTTMGKFAVGRDLYESLHRYAEDRIREKSESDQLFDE